jgi:predicted Zn-dependent protease with MMP-like domain
MIRISDDEFDRIVEQALAEIPDDFDPYLENVLVEVRARPDGDVRAQYPHPGHLLGLYIGRPLGEQGPDTIHTTLPDRILIFRENIKRVCRTRAELLEQIRVTVLHEVGHHFGLDEDQLDELGYG